jgi:hypothetical protein
LPQGPRSRKRGKPRQNIKNGPVNGAAVASLNPINSGSIRFPDLRPGASIGRPNDGIDPLRRPFADEGADFSRDLLRASVLARRGQRCF